MSAENSKQEQSAREGGGVADYFAILGVGENLVWKHAQKKSNFDSPPTDDPSVTDPQTDEDEAALVERFYREIVEVTILTSTLEDQHRPKVIGQAPSYTEDHDIRSVKSSSSLHQRMSSPALPNSPSHSDATTNVTFADPPVTSVQQQTERNGFTVVHRTCPAGEGFSQTDGASLGGILSANESTMSAKSEHDWSQNELWSKSQVFDANLDPVYGLRAEIASRVSSGVDTDGRSTPLKGLQRKLGTSLRKLNHMVDDRLASGNKQTPRTKFYLAFQRRGADETEKRAVADVALRFIRIHRLTVCTSDDGENLSVATETTSHSGRAATLKRSLATGASMAARVAEAGKHRILEKWPQDRARQRDEQPLRGAASFETQKTHGADTVILPLDELVPVPVGFDEWSIPQEFRLLRFSHHQIHPQHPDTSPEHGGQRKTILIPQTKLSDRENSETSSGVGVEAYMESGPIHCPPEGPRQKTIEPQQEEGRVSTIDPDVLLPELLPARLLDLNEMQNDNCYVYIPVLAVRRQQTGDEERYHEDAGVIDVSITFCDTDGNEVPPYSDDCEEEDEGGFSLTGKTKWTRASFSEVLNGERSSPTPPCTLGTPMVLVRRNVPIGFADAAFATQVLDRFPLKNYKDMPLPEEELPMFCYPTGCRLHRARYSDAPLPQYYGFVVKNERGDSIHVSCVSFMEPLTASKAEQLNNISNRRSRTSLAHQNYCEKKHLSLPKVGGPGSNVSDLLSYDGASQSKRSQANHGIDSPPSETSWRDDDSFLTGFSDMTTFENKTICLISRYPFWTAFRRFLSHLHVLSGSSSDLPLERCISHLLLSVPMPKPGGPCVLIPLPALNGPMLLSMPPAKDFPLVDLPFHRLLACLDVPTIITVVLGFLALERKIIIMSSRPSLVLDGCELLRSLLFPFELCAPYVPRLTQPFMSCLEFPGAIFVGIHDDGSPHGLASMVRNDLPEDSAIIDLDTGEIDCSGDRYEVLKQCWGIIPSGPRTVLVSEIETLCRDAGIVPGQEPLDSQVDSAFNASIPVGMVDDFGGASHEVAREPLDDRAIRDAFLRFFCSVLGDYERHLVVPDVDFLISGNEWFDAQGFLAGAPQERAPFLGSLVTTQLFQSFIQRRTETGDVHCLLFDECLVEFHSSPVPYGRLGGDVESVAKSDGGPPQMLYSLLVDQCSTEAYHPSWDEDDGKSRDLGISLSASSIQATESMLQDCGDVITSPSRRNLPEGKWFVYCIDGNPCFPQQLDASLFYPREPEALLTEMSAMPSTLLARTEREVEEATRRRKLATTYRGLHTQRRCLWQLPKLMGSHFLGAWLLCIPAQVSQSILSYDQQSRYLLRALGAFRLLRNKQRIVADEAAYRALIAACGRTGNDRRMELVKLFGLLRSDGIFPSAVTLGQYTRSLAEGYSKRSFGMPDDHHSGVEVTVSASRDDRIEVGGKDEVDAESLLNAIDGTLAILEDSGRRWRQRHGHNRDSTNQKKAISGIRGDGFVEPAIHGASRGVTSDSSSRLEVAKRITHRPWLPVMTSTSFVPLVHSSVNSHGNLDTDTRLLAIWSRTRACDSCSYLPLDEEIQAGWDVVGGQSDVAHTVSCPRCGSLLLPMLGYKYMSLREALGPPASDAAHQTAGGLPRQIVSHGNADSCTSGASGYVTYLDPASLRTSLERYVHEEGEGVLDRDELRDRDPELFFNFWFYCARFSLPLPLPISVEGAVHYCAFVSWDKSMAFQGCYSGARSLAPLYGLTVEQSNDSVMAREDMAALAKEGSLGESLLLSRFNLQEICQSDWDQKDLSEILVTLVEACDKRDFRPVLECVSRCNRSRLATAREARNDIPVELGLTSSTSFSDTRSLELDCYRTLLYLAKYQCTSVFHVFFPATAKPCKGYHFWCGIATPITVFDHLFREAAKRVRSKDNVIAPVHDVSDVALGFRCVFGHII